MSEVLKKCGFDSAAKVKLALLQAGVQLSAQDCVDAIMAHDGPGRITTRGAVKFPGRYTRGGFMDGGVFEQPPLYMSGYDFDDFEHQQSMAGLFSTD